MLTNNKLGKKNTAMGYKKALLTVYISVFSIIFVIIFGNIAFSSLALANTSEDAAITNTVKAKLAEEKDIPKLEVKTKDRVVTLKGKVDTHIQAHKAVEIASSVDNVEDVIDVELVVKESKSIINDALITAKVKGKIRHLYMTQKIASGYDLHVETTNGDVHIFGHVGRSADTDTIVAATKQIKGVRSVKTNIGCL